MAMSMDQMMKMMAHMHAQNYAYDMQLAQNFQGISNIYATMAQSEYQMYLQHSGQTQGMMQQMPCTMTQPMMPGMSSVVPTQG